MAKSKRSRPTKTRLKKGSAHLDNTKRKESKDTQNEKLNQIKKAQTFTDKWNLDYVGHLGMDDKDVTAHFEKIQLETGLVIQMYMENPIKRMVLNKETNEVIHVDYGVRQIDYRKRNTDKPHWGPTPFPVIDKGRILAISPATKLWYYEQQEKLAKYDSKAAAEMIIPEVGDIVYTKHFMFKDKRYYIDKQIKCKDFVQNQEELRLNNFDFLFLIENFEIESIVKAEHQETVSDYQVGLNERYEYLDVTPEMLSPMDPDLAEHLIEETNETV